MLLRINYFLVICSHMSHFRFYPYLLGLLIFSYPKAIHANPQNPQIIEGQVSIQYANELCKISAQDKSIIHWESFSIASHETTQFELPSSQGAVLNRVTGENSSALLGKLSANGTVYLINPHGILVGREGVINVGSFVASTLDVANQDFLLGKALHFSGESQAWIENQGQISAMQGDIVLLAQAIRNLGNLEANQGEIGRASCRERG